MVFTTEKELSVSWNLTETKDGQEIERIWYVPFAKLFGPRGGTDQIPALGDVLIDSTGVRYEKFRVVRVQSTLTKSDKEGARTSIFYSSAASTTVRQKEADLRTSWNSRFYSSMEVIEVNNKLVQTGNNAGLYVGAALDNPAIVYQPRFTYELTFYSSNHNISLFTANIGTVNSVDWFGKHREINTADAKIAESKELETIYSANDTGKWLFMDFSVNKLSFKNHEIIAQFVFNFYQWNPDATEGTPGVSLYPSTDFNILMSDAKKLQLPSTTPTRA